MEEHQVIIMDEVDIERAIIRIAHEILERNKNVRNLGIIGIKKRGDILAQRLAQCIERIEKINLPVGQLDITFYRDDLLSLSHQPPAHLTKIPFDISQKDVILVDDVLFAGRTIRSALNALMDFGRPKTIQLVVLIDRGHRELPIRPDYIGKSISTSEKEVVEVKLKELDKEEMVVIKQFLSR